MPELPEVETVVRGLRASLPGRRLVSVRLGKSDFIDDPAALGEELPGRRVLAVERIGKFICVQLTGRGGQAGQHGQDASAADLHFLIHLGMTGRLAVRSPAEPVAPHTHGFFELDDGHELRYTDIRRFGRMLLVSGEAMPEFQAGLGADALFVSRKQFAERARGRRARIKAFLLDQKALRGMGNIYADESLWRARIHPACPAANLGAEAIARLHRAMRQVLRAAIKLGGSSISDFLDAEGRRGSYQMRHRVYGREGERCFRCGARIERIIVAGRSSHYCPKCQQAPRARKRRKRIAARKGARRRSRR